MKKTVQAIENIKVTTHPDSISCAWVIEFTLKADCQFSKIPEVITVAALILCCVSFYNNTTLRRLRY